MTEGDETRIRPQSPAPSAMASPPAVVRFLVRGPTYIPTHQGSWAQRQAPSAPRCPSAFISAGGVASMRMHLRGDGAAVQHARARAFGAAVGWVVGHRICDWPVPTDGP